VTHKLGKAWHHHYGTLPGNQTTPRHLHYFLTLLECRACIFSDCKVCMVHPITGSTIHGSFITCISVPKCELNTPRKINQWDRNFKSGVVSQSSESWLNESKPVKALNGVYFATSTYPGRSPERPGRAKLSWAINSGGRDHHLNDCAYA
jgi:hypothetical protein